MIPLLSLQSQFLLLKLPDQLSVRLTRLVRLFFSSHVFPFGFKSHREQLLLDPLLSLPPQQGQDLLPLVAHGRVPLPFLLPLPEIGDAVELRSGTGGGGGAAALRPGHRQPLADIRRHQPGLERRQQGQGAPQLPGMGHVLRRGAFKHHEELMKLLLLRRISLDGHFYPPGPKQIGEK